MADKPTTPAPRTTLVGFTEPKALGLSTIEWPQPLDAELVFAPVANYMSQMSPAEAAQVANSVASRRAEYSTGRICAHLACEKLGASSDNLLSDAQRRPLWPASLVGAISHTDHLGAALVGPALRYAGLGVDIEGLGRVSADLVPRLLTKKEQGIAGLDPAIVFSAKEAVYKAINPLADAFIGFQEVQGEFDLAEKSFAMRYRGDHDASRALESGRGYWREWDGWVISIFVLDAKR